MIKPIRLAHFVLRSRHFDASKAWYQTVLGCRPVFENPLACFMTYDEEHHRVAILNAAGAPEPAYGAAGVDHIAFTFEGLGELLGTYRRLKGDGIEPYWSINHGPTTSLYYRDPDGNQIELQIDNFHTPEDFQAFLDGGSYQQNPIGVEFDADKLAERFEAGDPIEELVKQGAA